jgi:hypothetical protein
VPATVGVPLRIPLALRLSPGGAFEFGAKYQEYVPSPPVAENLTLG